MTVPARPLAVLALLLAAAAPPARAAPGEAGAAAFAATTLNLQAAGEVRLAPDLASLTLGVDTQAPTALQAQSDNARRMTAVVEALRRAGLSGRDVQTSRLSLSPQYAYAEGKAPRLTGYQASNAVTVTVRDLPRLPAALDAAATAGADHVDGVGFGLARPEAAEDAARRDAVRKLGAEAQLYAEATGLRVARLVNLSETGGYTPQPPRPVMFKAAMAESRAAVPVEAGEIVVRVEASAVYELAK